MIPHITLKLIASMLIELIDLIDRVGFPSVVRVKAEEQITKKGYCRAEGAWHPSFR